MIGFIVGLRASAARADTAEPAKLVRRMLAEYGRSQLLEWYHDYTVGKVVFDVDGKGDVTDPLTLLRAALAGVDAFFAPLPRPHLVIAQSHGPNKLSFRIFAQGFRMSIAHQKARLVARGLDKDRPFDGAIYGKNQKLRMVGSIKTPQDARVLALCDVGGAAIEPTADLLMSTLVQAVDDSWPLLTEDPVQHPVKRPVPAVAQPRAPKRAKVTVTEEPDVPAHEPADSGYKVPEDRERAFQLLRDNGFVNPVQVGLPRPSSLTFKADNRARCPCCGHDHEHINWWICQGADGCLLARSYSQRCRLTPVRPVMEIAADQEAAQALIAQRLDLVERRQGQTELEVAVIRNTLVDFGPHIETTLNQRINPGSVVMRSGGNGFNFNCDEDRADYLCEILVNPTCRLSCISDTRISPTVAGWVGNTTLNKIIDSERADTAYVEAFQHHERRQCGIEWRFDGSFYYSSGLTWTRVDNEQYLEQRILSLLQPALDALNTAASGGCLPTDMDAGERKRIKTGLRRAFNHIQQNRTTRDILKSARTVLYARDFASSMDRDRHLLGTPDGALDLRTGQLIPAAEFPPVSMSVRPRWRGLDTPTPDVDAFFRMIFADDSAMVDYMQALLGATITGERLEVYVCFVGAGANGKGVTVGWLRHVLGAYYKEADPYIFFGDKRSGTGPTPALAELDRKRLAVVDESNPTDELNLAIVKRVTGTDVISCRQLYRDPVEMPVTHTQILLTNNLPKFDVDDQALERRIVVIPFGLKFVKDADFDAANLKQRRADPTLARFLEGDSPSEQLLVWLVHGAMRFYATGNRLPPKPQAVRDAERGYYRDNDLLGQIIEELCECGDGYHVSVTLLNSAARARGAPSALKNAMQLRGHTLSMKRVNGQLTRVYNGLKMREEQ